MGGQGRESENEEEATFPKAFEEVEPQTLVTDGYELPRGRKQQ